MFLNNFFEFVFAGYGLVFMMMLMMIVITMTMPTIMIKCRPSLKSGQCAATN